MAPVPNQDAKPLGDAGVMLKEAKEFHKALGTFTSQLKGYEAQTYKLITASKGVSAGNSKERTEAVKSQMKQQLNTHVYEPIKQYTILYKKVNVEYKELTKKCSTYAKTEKAYDKAKNKISKAEQTGAPDEKRHKLEATAKSKDTTYEMAKSAYLSAAPQVLKDCELLLQKRNELRTNLFGAFSYAADALKTVATTGAKGT